MPAKPISDLNNLNKIRSSHNKELIRRMRNGESLTSFDSQSSWFPPRPIIEKDAEAINRLYSGKAESKRKATNKTSAPETESKVLKLVKAD